MLFRSDNTGSSNGNPNLLSYENFLSVRFSANVKSIPSLLTLSPLSKIRLDQKSCDFFFKENFVDVVFDIPVDF